jgi:hypothetical protein
MNKKMTLLAISVVSAAAMALPAVASAGTWHLEPAQNGTVAGGVTEVESSSGAIITCTSVSGTSKFDASSTTTGTISLTLHGCKNKPGFHCQTAGDPTGTITAPNLPFHLVHLEPNKTKPGILLTPNATSGNFAAFECAGIPHTLAGNGVLGELTSPACNAESTAAMFDFAAGAVQQWTQVTTTGTPYGLTLKVGGAAANPARQNEGLTITTLNKSKVNCT